LEGGGWDLFFRGQRFEISKWGLCIARVEPPATIRHCRGLSNSKKERCKEGAPTSTAAAGIGVIGHARDDN
jgi:hypothetical protein